jgi:hypothetical protein
MACPGAIVKNLTKNFFRKRVDFFGGVWYNIYVNKRNEVSLNENLRTSHSLQWRYLGTERKRLYCQDGKPQGFAPHQKMVQK